MARVEEGHLPGVTLAMAGSTRLAASPDTRLGHGVYGAANHSGLVFLAVVWEGLNSGEGSQLVPGRTTRRRGTVGHDTLLAID